MYSAVSVVSLSELLFHHADSTCRSVLSTGEYIVSIVYVHEYIGLTNFPVLLNTDILDKHFPIRNRSILVCYLQFSKQIKVNEKCSTSSDSPVIKISLQGSFLPFCET